MKRFLSWGCGIQSTTLAAMSALGELEPLDTIIHADTQWERQATVEIRDWYTTWLEEHGMTVEIVTAGNIKEDGAEHHISIPFWTNDGGPLLRKCTRHFKLNPIKRKVRNLLGYHSSKAPHPPAASAEQWLGISLDEWKRAKESDVAYLVNRWPLLENRMSRQDCVTWLESHSLPIPPKSACICCPYRRASEWIELRNESPLEFADAVAFDEAIRDNPLANSGGSTATHLFIYKYGEPLATADLERDAKRERRYLGVQLPFMVCESGLCWV